MLYIPNAADDYPRAHRDALPLAPDIIRNDYPRAQGGVYSAPPPVIVGEPGPEIMHGAPKGIDPAKVKRLVVGFETGYLQTRQPDGTVDINKWTPTEVSSVPRREGDDLPTVAYIFPPTELPKFEFTLNPDDLIVEGVASASLVTRRPTPSADPPTVILNGERVNVEVDAKTRTWRAIYPHVTVEDGQGNKTQMRLEMTRIFTPKWLEYDADLHTPAPWRKQTHRPLPYKRRCGRLLSRKARGLL